jgi:MazG family protein
MKTKKTQKASLAKVREQAAGLFAKFFDTVATLRHPKDGCPWDLKQSHRTLRKYMIEEAYEAAAAMGQPQNSKALADELGDVLLQVVLNAQVAWDNGTFDINDVIKGVDEKMKRRHPHVFGPLKGKISSTEIRSKWLAIKASEQPSQSKGAASGLFDKFIKDPLPASIKSRRIGERAKDIDFDWDDPKAVWATFRSEVDEASAAFMPRLNKTKLAEEIGDIYFTLGQVCRHLDMDPEVVAEGGNQKFLRRFAKVEALAAKRALNVATLPRMDKEKLWQEAKALERPTRKRASKTKRRR